LDYLGYEYVATPGHGLEQFLMAITQRATQLQSALHQRIIGHECVRPHRLHQFFLANQGARVLDEEFKGLIYFGAELDLLPLLEDTSPCEIQRELAELIP
jgi:hypothetical protein